MIDQFKSITISSIYLPVYMDNNTVYSIIILCDKKLGKFFE